MIGPLAGQSPAARPECPRVPGSEVRVNRRFERPSGLSPSRGPLAPRRAWTNDSAAVCGSQAFHEFVCAGSQIEKEMSHGIDQERDRVEAPAESVWDAVRDVGAVHERLVPGFVVDTRLEDGARVVTFANGVVARELIVDVDDTARRLVWAVVGSPRLTHHNASVQVVPDGERRSRVVWIADVLPNEIAGYMAGLLDQGLAVMKKTLE